MDCEIPRILYLRANGELPCNCSWGEAVNLGWLPEDGYWDPDAHFAGPRLSAVRAGLESGTAPWEACRGCAFFREAEPYRGGPHGRRLEKVHIEPSLACALRCPGCSRVRQAAERRGPVFLPLAQYDRFLSRLAEQGYAVDFFFFCGQGEPLSHPQAAQMLALTRAHFPRSSRVVNTNGNHEYGAVLPVGGADRLIVSVDGAQADSYGQYRIRGHFDQAVRFMREAKRAGHGALVEWKYILFTYNDGDEELVAAQRLAEDLGVDSLQFVLTHTPERSRRYTHDNIDQLPLVSPLAYVEPTPQLHHRRRYLRAQDPADSRLRPDFTGGAALWCVVDEVWAMGSQFGLRGWAFAPGGQLRALRASLNGSDLGRAVVGTPRPDVLAALPEVGSYHVGFRLVAPLPELLPTNQLVLEAELADGARHPLVMRWA